MSAQPFDTHAAVKRLSAAGFTEAQAEMLVSTLLGGHEHLTTKADIRDMATNTALQKLEIRLLKYLLAQGVAIVGFTVALIKLL